MQIAYVIATKDGSWFFQGAGRWTKFAECAYTMTRTDALRALALWADNAEKYKVVTQKSAMRAA